MNTVTAVRVVFRLAHQAEIPPFVTVTKRVTTPDDKKPEATFVRNADALFDELLERGFVLSGYLRGSIGEQGEKPRITFYFYPVVQKKPKKHVKRLFRKLASGEHHVETYRRDDNGVLGLYLKPLHLLRLEQRSS